jgi:hypothetical protein
MTSPLWRGMKGKAADPPVGVEHGEGIGRRRINIEAKRAQSVRAVHKYLTESDRRWTPEDMETTLGRRSKPRRQLGDGKVT